MAKNGAEAAVHFTSGLERNVQTMRRSTLVSRFDTTLRSYIDSTSKYSKEPKFEHLEKYNNSQVQKGVIPWANLVSES